MPFIRMETSVSLTDDQKAELTPALSKIVSGATQKPEAYVMAVVSEAAFCMAGKPGPAAFLDIRSIGALNQQVNRKISEEVCDLLKQSLDISPDRVYLSFNDVQGVNWGWNRSTFG